MARFSLEKERLVIHELRTFKWLFRVLLYAWLAIASTAAAEFRYHERQIYPVYPNESWQVAKDPELLGWHYGKLEKARSFSDCIGSAAVMIVQDGIVVAAWGKIASRYPIHSIRKPLMSAMVGIHVAEGHIDISKTLDELGIDDIAPSLTRAEKQATIADLLTSRSGVYHRKTHPRMFSKHLQRDLLLLRSIVFPRVVQ